MVTAVPFNAAAYEYRRKRSIDRSILFRRILTLDFGALYTVKLPWPPFDKAGFLTVLFAEWLFTAAFFVARTGAAVVDDDDWSGLAPVPFGRR